jgi:hypothetical protein
MTRRGNDDNSVFSMFWSALVVKYDCCDASDRPHRMSGSVASMLVDMTHASIFKQFWWIHLSDRSLGETDDPAKIAVMVPGKGRWFQPAVDLRAYIHSILHINECIRRNRFVNEEMTFVKQSAHARREHVWILKLIFWETFASRSAFDFLSGAVRMFLRPTLTERQRGFSISIPIWEGMLRAVF